MSFVDNFNGTAGASLSTHTPDTGTGWTKTNNEFLVIDADGASLATSGFNLTGSYICDSQGSANHETIIQRGSYFAGTGLNNLFAAVVRLQDRNNFAGGHYLFSTGSAGRRLAKRVASTTTDLVTSQGVASEWIKVDANGTTVRMFSGGTGATPSWAQVGTDQTVTDFSSVTGQGIAALGNASGSNALAYFEANALGGGGTTGTSATTNANDTASASGTTTIVGSLARTNANDSLAASGTTTIVGTLAYTNANDSLSASGAAGAISGTVDYTNRDDTLSAAGWAGTISGTLDYTNHNDTLAASGHAGSVQWGATGGLPGKKKKKEWRDRDRESRRNAILAQLTPAEPLPPAPIIAKPAIDNQALRDLLKRVKRADIMPAYIEKPAQKVAVIEDDEEEELLLLL